MENLLDVFLDSLKDSALVFLISFLVYFLFSYIGDRIINNLQSHPNSSVLTGSLLGVVPQCSLAVISADLYSKKMISTGTIFAIFFASSDEALPLLLKDLKILDALLLISLKIIFGFLIGFIINKVKKEELVKVELENSSCCSCKNHNKEKVHKHLVHPLLDALKIFIYAFLVSFIFGLIIESVGEDNIKNFFQTNEYLSPLFGVLIGLVPNCSASVLITEMYLDGFIKFGVLFASLACNSGLGFLYLLKNKETTKKALTIILPLLVISSLVLGYLFILIA